MVAYIVLCHRPPRPHGRDARLGRILGQRDHAVLGRRGVGGERQLQDPRGVVERRLGRGAVLDDVQKVGDLAGKGLRQVIGDLRELDRLRPAMELVDEPGLAAGQLPCSAATSKCQPPTGLNAQLVMISPIAPEAKRTRSTPRYLRSSAA